MDEYEKWLSNVDLLDDQSDECVYRYWLNCSLYPQLRNLALRTSAVPTSSTDVERLFSIANYVVGPNRCSMTKDNMEIAFLLYANFQIIKKEI